MRRTDGPDKTMQQGIKYVRKKQPIWYCLPAGLFILAVLAIIPFRIYAETTESGQDIRVPFYSSFSSVCEWEFPYSDSLFLQPSEEFSEDLAKASMGLTVSAFRQEGDELDNQYETYLSAAGFTDIHAFGYDQETSSESLSGVIACRKIGDFTLVAAAPAGQGYQKEWAGNLEVGDEERHVGFNKAARILEEQLVSYIENHDLNGKLKLWIVGFSRASAVSNLTAADMIDSGLFEDVYAYLFAVPRTTRDPDYYLYKGIFNICGAYDPVTQIPPESWGYMRYGTDYFTPVPEMNSMYPELYFGCLGVSRKLVNDRFRYNPEVSYQLHLIIEFLGELFPSNAEYAEKFQDLLMDVWRKDSTESFFLILSEALSRLKDLDQRQEYSSRILIDYLTYITSQHLKQSVEQVERGYWNPGQTIAENVIREHMAYTYIDWIFSDNDPMAVYHGPNVTRRLYLYGDIDVRIFKNGTIVTGISSNGKLIRPTLAELSDMTEEEFYSDVFLMRQGTQTVACLPADGEYEVRIRTKGTENINYYDVICTPYLTYGAADTMISSLVTEGEYVLALSGADILPSLQAAEGRVIELVGYPFNYSPTMIMADESSSVYHITIGELAAILLGFILMILLLMLVCLIIFIVHAVRKKKRKKPYSPWFVIVPHLLLIIIFALLTQYFTYNLYVISIFRVISAALTMLTLFLLSLRGLIRRRCLPNVLITAFLFAIGIVNVLLYQRSSMVSSAVLHFIIYGMCLLLLSTLACSTFYMKKGSCSAMDPAGNGHKEMDQ